MNSEKFLEFVEKINQLDGKVKLGILVGIIVVLVGIYWYWFWSPKQEDIRALDLQIQKQTKVLTEYKTIEAQLPEFEKQFKELTIQYEAARRKLPTKQEIPGLIEAIYTAVSQSGLEPDTFTPKKEVRREIYAEIPVQMKVFGSYYTLARFFDNVSKLPRIVNVKNLQLSRPKGGGTSLQASFTAVTFRMLPQSEIQVQTKKGKGKKGSRKR